MVMLSMAAGGVMGGAMNMASYNRDGWMTNVQVDQNRRYQRQQVRLSQAEMFREDIRDLVGSSVMSQANYLLIATLTLGMIAAAYVEGQLPDGAAEFVASSYLLCVGSSLLYVVLSLICAISANNLASACQKDLLTTFVRLPVDELVEEIEAAASHETAEAFERQRWRNIFRLPGMSRVRPRERSFSDPSRDTCEDVGHHAKNMHGCSYSAGGCAVPPSLPVEPQQDSAERHLRVFYERESQWAALGKFSFIFGALGASHLIQAYGYYAAAKYYTGSRWASWVVQLLMVLVDAIFTRTYLTKSTLGGILGAVITIIGPVSCTLAIRNTHSLVDRICIPLSFFCHFSWNCYGFWILAHEAREAARENQKAGLRLRSSSFLDASEGSSSRRRRWNKKRPREALAKQSPEGSTRRYHSVIFLGSGAVVLAWLVTLGWAVCSAWHGIGDNGRIPDEHGLLGSMSDPAESLAPAATFPLSADTGDVSFVSFEDFAVAWPSPRFRPRSLACGADGSCFVANEFVIFAASFDSKDATLLSPWTHVPCNTTGAIRDLAVACDDDGKCRPLALTAAGGASVVDCTKQESKQWTGMGDASLLSVRSNDSLYTTNSGNVIQRGRADPPQYGWVPQWPVVKIQSDTLAAIDTVGDAGNMVLFGRSGVLQFVDLDSGTPCGVRLLRDRTKELLSGSTWLNQSSLMVLVRTGMKPFETTLGRIPLQGIARICKSAKGEQARMLPRLRGSR